MTKNKGTVTVGIAQNNSQLAKLEEKYQLQDRDEFIIYSKGESFEKIANTIIPDKSGVWANPVYMFVSKHSLLIGITELQKKINEFLNVKKKETLFDPLSISVKLVGDYLEAYVLIRFYGQKIKFGELYDFIGVKQDNNINEEKSKLIIPNDIKRNYTEEEKELHLQMVEEQDEKLKTSSIQKPFLNQLDTYIPRRLEEIDSREELVYNLKAKDMQIKTICDYEHFVSIFQEAMGYITEAEKNSYYSVLRGQKDEESFMEMLKAYIQRTFVDTLRLQREDVPALIEKLHRALFELYIVQDLIDDPDISDIKITDPYSIRVRIKGKAYLSNITFIDQADYIRFINGVATVNGINLGVPTQTFTDEQDEQYLLRFSITAPYITCSGYPIIHIRKLPRKKLMADDLIKAGMMDEKIRNYLLDCGKYSKGVVFAGPPGSGKTTLLNWFLEEAYESSAEILCIQENDELFAYRKGIMFEHVVLNPQNGQQPCTLEQLGQMALVAGANVFIIGEVKGPEVVSAITLSNSGCRTALSIHSQSARDASDKLVDLTLRGMQNVTYEQAKRSTKSFDTIVYLQDFAVQEIVQVKGYNEEKKDMDYIQIYKKEI